MKKIIITKINILRYQYILVTIIWTLLAFLIVVSIYNSPMDFLINSIVAILFISFSILIYRRGMTLHSLLLEYKHTKQSTQKTLYNKVIKYELISMIIIGIIGLFFLFAAFSRIFYEGYAVFG